MTTVKGGAAARADGPDAKTNPIGGGLAASMAFPQKMVEANLQTSVELLIFMSRRIKSQAELWGEFGHCHDFGSALNAQRKFAACVTKDYSDEMTHLVEMARQHFDTVTHALADHAGQAGNSAGKAGRAA